MEACRFEEGCENPRPPLLELDAVALMIFEDCLTQWHTMSGLAGGVRIGLIYSEVSSYAKDIGIELDYPLWERIRELERWMITHERTSKAPPPGEEDVN